MIEYVVGDIFSSPAQVLVNAVNTVGVMGKGIALEFKNRYPDMFLSYKKACENKTLDIGKLMLWKETNYWVLIFPTKRHWKDPAKLEYIEAGLKDFEKIWESVGIQSIAFPKLGCGNGGLDWDDVRPIMERYLSELPIKVFVYV